MNQKELIEGIWDCIIDVHNSCGMITIDEAMKKSVELIDGYDLSKLSQPDVIKVRKKFERRLVVINKNLKKRRQCKK